MIELKNITAGYGKTEILHGISVSFAKGKLYSIIGPNGAGKSTLLKVVLGFLPPFVGNITIDGDEIAALGRKETAKRIAYLPQGKAIPDMTVEQMVLHGRFAHLSYPRVYTQADRQIAQEAIERMGLTKERHRPLAELSGGMRQKAYLAMALTQQSAYILLDEPTTHLDITHQMTLMKQLRALADAGKGVVSVMHDLPLALTASDEVLLLCDGKLLMRDAPARIVQEGCIRSVFGVDVVKTADGYHYRYE